jgi:hypothetical protein
MFANVFGPSQTLSCQDVCVRAVKSRNRHHEWWSHPDIEQYLPCCWLSAVQAWASASASPQHASLCAIGTCMRGVQSCMQALRVAAKRRRCMSAARSRSGENLDSSSPCEASRGQFRDVLASVPRAPPYRSLHSPTISPESRHNVLQIFALVCCSARLCSTAFGRLPPVLKIARRETLA